MMTVDEVKKVLMIETDQELATKAGRGASAVSNWKKAGEVPASILVKLGLLWGEKPLSEIIEKVRTPINESCQLVDIFNMVEGGPGTEPEWHEPIDKRAIPSIFLKPNIRPVLVRGRSMEPTFKNGAIIGVDQGDKQVIEGEAYAIMLPYAGAAVKRLYPLPGGVLIRSDNKEFPEVTLKKEDVPEYFILGRVCWVVQEV